MFNYKNICLLLFIFALALINIAQADDVYILGEISVVGTRNERDTFEIPNAISIVTSDDIKRQGLGTTPDILRGATGIMVQKTSAGQGSPYVRGLTGYQTLIIIDGVRLNNATFRSGPNQYLATINPGQIAKIEVLRGYGSALYGSSAIGGVISVLTQSPTEKYEDFSIHPHITTRYSSADSGKFGRIGLDGGYKNFGITTGVSYKDVDNLKPGKGYDIQLPTKKFLLTSQSDPNIPEGAWLVDTEEPTGWKEKDGDVKLNYMISDKQDVKLAYQGVRQENVPRYDKYATGEYKTLLFNPQNRDLAYLSYTAKEAFPFFHFLQATISYQKQNEGQKQQKANSTSITKIDDVTDIMGLSLQLDSILGDRQKITYGSEFYHDKLNSQSVTTDTETDKVKKEAWGAYPDGATYQDINVYVQDELKILENLNAILAGIYTNYQSEADLSIKDPSFESFENSGNAVTGSVGLAYEVIKGLNLTFTAGQAFRAPSLSDTTAVKITNQAISAPNPDLRPERSSGIDVGFKTRSNYFAGTVNYYFNRIKGSLVSMTVQEAFAGKDMPKLYQDLIDANQDAKVSIAHNSDEPTDIQGVEIAVNRAVLPLYPALSAYGNLTITRVQDAAENQPILREMPVNGILGIRWNESEGRFWMETYSRFAAKQDRLSKSDRSDPRIPGTTNDPSKEDPRAYTPGWFTLNVRVGTDIGGAGIALGIENILDRRYREHGSGVDGSGRNFYTNVGYRF